MPVAPADAKEGLSHPLNLLRLRGTRFRHGKIASVNDTFLFPDFPRATLSLRGGDRVEFLHRLVSHDIKGLPVGQARPACLLDRQGRILFAALVHARRDELLLEVDPGSLATAQAQLERYLISEKVEWSDAADRFRILPLHGPAGAEILRAVWPELRLPEQNLAHLPGPEGSPVRLIARWDLFGRPGVQLWVEPSRREEVLAKLSQGGKPFGLKAGSQELFHALRIEAGVPWPGAEMTAEVILNELGSEEWVSFTKGCFIGQEIVARIKYRAHPPRLLTGFFVEATAAPPAPVPVHAGTGTAQTQRAAGLITSACLSPSLNRPIALGFLQYGLEGSDLTLQLPGGKSQRVAPTVLPFAR